MKKHYLESENRAASQVARVGVQIIRRYWIGLTFLAVLGLAIVAPPAEAAPMPQRTVPTATPEPTDPPPDNDDDDDDDDNNNSSVLDLFEPTPTPEPFDLDFDDNFDDDEPLGGSDGLGSGGLGGGGFTDDDSDDNSDPFADDATADFDEFDFDDDGLNGIVDASFVNMFSGPDANSGIIDTLFRNTSIQVLGRDATGEWVQICCGEDRGNQGWVPAGDLNLGFDLDAPELELPTFGEDPLLDETFLGDLELDEELADLELNMFIDSSNVRPGQVIELQYEVTNIGDVDAFDVSLRNELPSILAFEDAEFVDGALTETTNVGNNDAPVFRIDWPELAAGDTVTATVVIQVNDDAQYGVVVDNLAGVGATNANIETAGVTMGTPPRLPPEFRFTR